MGVSLRTVRNKIREYGLPAWSPLMSWMNSAPMMLLERYLDGTSMRQTLVSTTIANVDTPGYSRQVPNLEETTPVQIGNNTFGTGVDLASVTSLRDSVLDLRVNQETQQQGQLNAFISTGQQIQALFNETNGTGLQAPLTAFFTSLSQLSTNPVTLILDKAF